MAVLYKIFARIIYWISRFRRLVGIFAVVAFVLAMVVTDDFWSGFFIILAFGAYIFHFILSVLTDGPGQYYFYYTGSFSGVFDALKKGRLIEDTPTSKIRSAAQGYVELEGQSRPFVKNNATIAPLSRKPCVWYSYSIEKINSDLTTIEHGTSDSLFLITDDTGECIIDPEGARVKTVHSDTWYNGAYRYKEERLHANEDLYATGLFKATGSSDDLQSELNDEVKGLLKLWKRNSKAMLARFDENKDGQIDVHEWEKVREAALQQALAKQKNRAMSKPVNLLSDTHDKQRPFMLSAVPQPKLIKSYFSRSLWFFFLIVAAVVAAFYFYIRSQSF